MNDPIPESLAAATAEQPGARSVLAAALRAGPSHAYAFVGPAGSGKAAAARALVAELIASGVPDPDDARRRVLLDPSPHPDLVWLRPPGNQHLVEDVRREVIAATAYRPFEGGRRAFVIERAEAMAEESQNALLKTLEEPPPYAHLILITAEPASLLETVRSRCQEISFAPLTVEVVERHLRAELPGLSAPQLAALGALSGGDLERARLLGSPWGARMREIVEGCARAVRGGRLIDRPWAELLAVAAERGKDQAIVVIQGAEERAEGLGKGREATRVRRDGEEAAKRADRRARTEAIDLGLGLLADWFADLVAIVEGAPELASNADRLEVLEAEARGLDAGAARRVAELAMITRRRLGVNVNEDLALDALFHRSALLLGEVDAVL